MDAREYALGARWRPHLPPGVFEWAVTSTPLRDVRMDVAAFIGLAERGPVGAPVSVDSWSEFTTWFGLEQEPSIWISFVVSMAVLALVMRRG